MTADVGKARNDNAHVTGFLLALAFATSGGFRPTPPTPPSHPAANNDFERLLYRIIHLVSIGMTARAEVGGCEASQYLAFRDRDEQSAVYFSEGREIAAFASDFQQGPDPHLLSCPEPIAIDLAAAVQRERENVAVLYIWPMTGEYASGRSLPEPLIAVDGQRLRRCSGRVVITGNRRQLAVGEGAGQIVFEVIPARHAGRCEEKRKYHSRFGRSVVNRFVAEARQLVSPPKTIMQRLAKDLLREDDGRIRREEQAAAVRQAVLRRARGVGVEDVLRAEVRRVDA